MNDTTKTCTKCGNTYPATTEYFHASNQTKSGLQARCKGCIATYYQANKEQRLKYRNEYYQANQEQILKQRREYYQVNQDKRREYQLEYGRKYRQVNLNKKREQNREYQHANLDKARIRTTRRRARKQSLPDTFTEQQWITCLEYFGYACAVCGVSFEAIQPHADHWIPLSSDECTGTIATNMVCLCSVCNLSKHNIMPDIWLMERYSADMADEILERIEEYFKFVVR